MTTEAICLRGMHESQLVWSDKARITMIEALKTAQKKVPGKPGPSCSLLQAGTLDKVKQIKAMRTTDFMRTSLALGVLTADTRMKPVRSNPHSDSIE